MKKLRVGLVGLGRLGVTHAKNLAFSVPNAELYAVCSSSEEKRAWAKEELGVQAVYSEYAELLKDEAVEAVVIVTSSGVHCEQIEMALRAGKHVFCEKPLGVDEAQCLRAARAANEHPELTVMLGFMRRYDESYAYAKARIDAGEIGTPYLFKGTAMDPESVIGECIRYSNSSSGIFLDLAIHDIDLIRWYLGSEIVEAHAMGATFKYPELKAAGDDETGVAMYKLENGAMALLHVGRSAPHGYHIETEIVGTKGSIRISPVPQRNLAVLYDARGVVTECVENFPERFADAYRNELIEFADCVLTGRKPGATVQDGVMSTRVAFATKKSWKTGEIVRVEP